MSCQNIKPGKKPKCDEIQAESKDVYSFDFEKKIAYKNGEEFAKIISHTDTTITVKWGTIEQEFRLYTPIKNFTNFEA